MQLIDLFSGVGGFSLAGSWMGWKTVQFVEIDPFCRKILNKQWPDVPIHSDINNVTVDNYGNLLYLCENGDINMGTIRLTKYDNAVLLYETGMSIQECAEFYEISRQAMHKILIRRNCKFREHLKYGEDNHFHRGCLPNFTKKKRVQHLVEKAIKKGVLINPNKCENCGCNNNYIDGRSGIQAHHGNYDEPLNVNWLCRKCHYKWHITNKAINETDKEKTGNPTGAADMLTGGFP